MNRVPLPQQHSFSKSILFSSSQQTNKRPFFVPFRSSQTNNQNAFSSFPFPRARVYIFDSGISSPTRTINLPVLLPLKSFKKWLGT